METNIDYIKTVKIQGEGYLVNGSLSVPNSLENRHMRDVQAWLDAGNTPEPEFTSEEIEANEIALKIAEAKQYLSDTDYKVLPDYDGNTDGIIEARADARATIRAIEAE